MKKLQEYLEDRIKLLKQIEEFNLLEMDHSPEFKEYHHREYLIAYYSIQELKEVIDKINQLESKGE